MGTSRIVRLPQFQDYNKDITLAVVFNGMDILRYGMEVQHFLAKSHNPYYTLLCTPSLKKLTVSGVHDRLNYCQQFKNVALRGMRPAGYSLDTLAR
jgi:hypothetical protein